jgi:hypothetical protein
METKFRALRLIALFYKILAWLTLVGGILGALGLVVFGATLGRTGMRSPIEGMPLVGANITTVTSVFGALLALVFVLVQFVLLYAMSEAIQLALAIEKNTRMTAYYAFNQGAGEPPADGAWQETLPPVPQS